MCRTVSLESLESAPNNRSCAVNRLRHCWHFKCSTPLRPRPAFTASILQLWQVTVNLLEIHSQEADNGFAGHCSFGCGDYSPYWCFNTDRGFLLHVYIILDPLM